MGGYVVRRVLQMVPTLLAIVVASFALIHFIPGDPATTLAGEEADPAAVAQIREALGLDDPLVTQFVRYAGKLAGGDLGFSFTYGIPVRDVIINVLPYTVLLTGTALVVSTALGLWLGVVAVRRPGGPVDQFIGGLTLTMFAVPGFWLAQGAIVLLVLRFPLFPPGGLEEAGPDAPSGLGHIADVAHHLMLPAMVLAASEVAAVTRLVRSSLLSQLGCDYTRTAAAKGLASNVVLARHVLRNALLPVVTLVGTRVGFLFSGAVVIESIFAWPGLGGALRAAATSSKDPPLLLGIVIVTSAAVMVANLATDLVYRWVDPRIRLG